ncbi:MAG: 50S ribosomal protein L10 [SAR202 cluster bacterium]|nr:50S ribosomal protein L10 [SAR202 cluster bacterium]
MPSQRNVLTVSELRGKLERGKVVIAADYTGLDVATISALRRKLKESGSEIVVAKNTLTKLAADGIGKGALASSLTGPTALVVGYQDPIQSARGLSDYVRTTRVNFKIRGGVLGGQPMTPQDVERLAAISSEREVMAQLAGQLLASLSMLVGVLNAPVRGLATVMQRSAEKQPAQT